MGVAYLAGVQVQAVLVVVDPREHVAFIADVDAVGVGFGGGRAVWLVLLGDDGGDGLELGGAGLEGGTCQDGEDEVGEGWF